MQDVWTIAHEQEAIDDAKKQGFGKNLLTEHSSYSTDKTKTFRKYLIEQILWMKTDEKLL